MLNLNAYLERIGYGGSTAPNLDTLSSIVAQHVSTVPFENLDILLNRRIGLEPEDLARKLVDDRRGGYCFEQNGLLLLVLEALGFDVAPLSARVRLDRPRSMTPTRTHLFLKVTLGAGDWFADVGIGGLSPTSPVRMELDSEQASPHEPRRIIREDGVYFHQALVGGEWKDIYEFTLEEMPHIDRVVANWYTSANPNSKFRNEFFCARAGEEGTRYSILNDRFICRRGADVLETIDISTPDERLEILRTKFGLCFPAGTEFQWPVAPLGSG